MKCLSCRWFAALLMCSAVLADWNSHSKLAAAETMPPFVAGFDRFGRHDEISDVHAGRLLLTELSCTACHAPSGAGLMPKRGPKLDAIGSRANRDWVQRYLMNPQWVKPGTTMPDALAGLPTKKRQEAAVALAAFLSEQTQPFPEIKATGANPVPFEFWKHGNAEQGRILYHRIGCVACHAADEDYEVAEMKASPIDAMLEQLDPEEIKELGLLSAARRVESVPHGDLAAKYSHQSLTHFLLKPEAARPAGRMPDFDLKAVDAADIAAWLLSKQTQASTSGDGDEQLVAAGRTLFTSIGCSNCHDIKGLQSQHKAKPLAVLHANAATSCFVAEQQTSGQPFYPLDDVQKQTINAVLASVRENTALADHDSVQLTLLQLNCYACHTRDKLGGVGRFRKAYFETVGHVDIGDEGRLPPALTGVGGKLTTSAMKNVFSGKGRIRPHMFVRMPGFPSRLLEPLPTLFAKTDQIANPLAADAVFKVQKSDRLVAAGRALMDSGCVQCHSFSGEALPGTVGTDLRGMAARVHPQWFHDFLLNPGKLKARTRMPTFFPNGESQNKDILEGDTEQQIAAMWAYLSDLNRQPLPEKILKARAQDYELTPTKRPIVLRTFMQRAGTHAIAVGFPQKVHYAFDAETLSLSEAWRGRFVDAEGTWFVRAAPPAKPLGETVIPLPSGVVLAALPNSGAAWPTDAEAANAKFSGYRLDARGVPTMLYEIGGVTVEDRIEPLELQGLKRTLTLVRRQPDSQSSTLWLRPLTGASLTKVGEASYRNETGLAVEVAVNGGSVKGESRRNEGVSEWLVSVDVAEQSVIEVRYSW